MSPKKFLGITANSLLAIMLLAGCDKLGAYNHWQAGDLKPDVADLCYGRTNGRFSIFTCPMYQPGQHRL